MENEELDNDLGQKEFSPIDNQPQLSEIHNFGWLNNIESRSKLIENNYFKEIIKKNIFDEPLPPKAVIDHTVLNALHILGRCNNPNLWETEDEETVWKTHFDSNKFYQNKQGLVYGMVQSGKTASMLTLMGLAHSSGYNLLILLSSDKESLRNQTQERVNKTFHLKENGEYDRYDKDGEEIGVETKIKSITDIPPQDSKSTGDYEKQTQEIIKNLQQSVTMIICIKKNPKVLDKLLYDLNSTKNSKPELYEKIKCLIIDDEADYASQNTSKQIPSPLHTKIVEIRKIISRNTFVQYTATPQACLLSDPKLLVGYPKDFLWLLDIYRDPKTKKNPSYLGHNEFFSEYAEDLVVEIDKTSWPHYEKTKGKKEGVRVYTDDLVIPGNLKDEELKTLDVFITNNLIRQEICHNYKDAIIDFLITCSLRWYRYFKNNNFDNTLPSKGLIESDYPHHAMIFNLATIKDQHDNILTLIEKIYNDAEHDFYELDIMKENNSFYKQYQKQYQKSLKLVKKEIPSLIDLKYFIDLAMKITSGTILGKQNYIYLLNTSNNGSILQYKDKYASNYTKKAAIFIGGHILGRGLTVKNLSTSFFVRSQVKSLGDTNLQMCRWFGHKKKDLDIQSLYTNKQNLNLFQSISNADNSLREEFWESMHTNQPAECFLINLQSNNLFRLTSPSKSRFGKLSHKSFSGQHKYLEWPKKHESFERNSDILDEFLSERKSTFMHKRAKVYYGIDPKEFMQFFKKLFVENHLTNVTPEIYIEYLNKYDNLPKVNIAVFGKNEKLRNSQNFNDQYVNYAGITRSQSDYKYMGDKWVDKDKNFHKQIESIKRPKREINEPILLTFYKVNQNYINDEHKKKEPDKVEQGKKLPPLILYGIHSPLGGPSEEVTINKEIDREREKILEICENWQQDIISNEN